MGGTDANADGAEGGEGDEGEICGEARDEKLARANQGEEDEIAAFEGRCKLYRLEKGEKGTDEYKDFGSGILRLNKHKETGRRRALIRRDDGKISLNVSLYDKMSVKAKGKKDVQTMVMEKDADGKDVSTIIFVRCDTPEIRDTLLEVWQKLV